MHAKWWGARALVLHLLLGAWLVLCALAAWWQIGRAVGGNALSYLYAIEWPVFGVLGVIGWFALINLEKVSAQDEEARAAYEQHMRAAARAARERESEEDPLLAAYNDHLEQLATRTKRRLWGHS